MSEYYQPQLPDMPPERYVLAPQELHFRYIVDHLIEVELVPEENRQEIINNWREDYYGK
jgi:hypothetical protein